MPFVFVNMAMTLDGKIASAGRENFSLGSKADRREMDRLRAEADIVLWGGETLRVARYPGRIQDKSFVASRVARKLSPQPANGVITRSGNIPESLPWLDADDVSRFIFTTEDGFAEAEKAAGGRAEIVLIGKSALSAHEIVTCLSQRGIERILLEGGGGVNWLFAEAGLVNVLHVTLTPWLAGGEDAPTILEGKGFPAGQFLRLELVEVRQEGQEVFLRYRTKK